MEAYAPVRLRQEVMDEGLCPLCGGCAGACPYLGQYRGRIVQLDCCTLVDGSCYQWCPRTYTDVDALSQSLFGVPFGESELGVVRESVLARSTDERTRERESGGGVVSALLGVALDEGMIDAAIVTGESSDERADGLLERNVASGLSRTQGLTGLLARSKEQVVTSMEAGLATARVLPTLNSVPKEASERYGIVSLPCQVASLAKRRMLPPEGRVSMDNVKVVVGLFCATKRQLEPGESREETNRACSYCWDLTAEFADISVGSGRAKFKDWNTVLARSDTGAKLLELARAKGVLESQALPTESLAVEQKASLNKKRRAAKNLVEKTGDRRNLLYWGMREEVAEALLG
ncbi:MAG: Coenzyme F420 hydrogenase/dehydrogenase, beta subunit C-terminal domain [Chloroflexota bacterium]